MWSKTSNKFLIKLLKQGHALSSNGNILWDHVAKDTTLMRHVIIHVLQCCDDAHYVPEAIMSSNDKLQPLAFALIATMGIPLTKKQDAHVLILCETQKDLTKPIEKSCLGICLLETL